MSGGREHNTQNGVGNDGRAYAERTVPCFTIHRSTCMQSMLQTARVKHFTYVSHMPSSRWNHMGVS